MASLLLIVPCRADADPVSCSGGRRGRRRRGVAWSGVTSVQKARESRRHRAAKSRSTHFLPSDASVAILPAVKSLVRRSDG